MKYNAVKVHDLICLVECSPKPRTDKLSVHMTTAVNMSRFILIFIYLSIFSEPSCCWRRVLSETMQQIDFIDLEN